MMSPSSFSCSTTACTAQFACTRSATFRAASPAPICAIPILPRSPNPTARWACAWRAPPTSPRPSSRPPAPATDGHVVRSPIDGAEIGRVAYDDARTIEAKIAGSAEAFKTWRDVPAPRRGELVRLFGEELRANKQALGQLVTLEAGKIVQE